MLEKTFVPGAKEETVPRREPEAIENGARGTADEVSGQAGYVVRCADGQCSVVATLPETSSDMPEAKEAKEGKTAEDVGAGTTMPDEGDEHAIVENITEPSNGPYVPVGTKHGATAETLPQKDVPVLSEQSPINDLSQDSLRMWAIKHVSCGLVLT